MVEFGLKLEDNKVSEWSEYYLNYEKLKAILKKAKASHKKYDEQAKKQPDDAARILEAHRAGNVHYVTAATPRGSTTNLSAMTVAPAASSEPPPPPLQPPPPPPPQVIVVPQPPPPPTSSSSQQQQQDETPPPNEQTSLLSADANAPTPQKKKNVTSLITTRLSDITDFWGNGSRYERTLRGYLKETEDLETEFEELLTKEQKKVTAFYYAKLEELEDRLHYLKESVAQSSVIITTSSSIEATDDEGIPHPRRGGSPRKPRRQNSRIQDIISQLSNSMKHNLEQQFHRQTQHTPYHPPKDKVKSSHNSNHSMIRDCNSDDEDDDDKDEKGRNKKKDKKAVAEADSIQRALVDQYRTAKLLHNYAILNYTGVVKIVKKHDKSLPTMKGKFKWLLEPQHLFHEGKQVDDLANQYEQYYANWFCEGDLRAAHAQMLPKRGDGLEMDWSQLRLGYRMGMCAVLALWVCWDCVWGLVSDGNSTIGGRAAFPVFRACGGILLLQWFWGCSVFIWTRFRVNYIYLFDFNPRIVASPLGIFEEAVDNSLVFLLLMLLYYKSGAHDIPAWIPAGGYPFILVLYTTAQLIFPLRTRGPMWDAVWKTVTAPMHSPSFFHGYVGDIFTSMVKVFQDVAWTICWVFSGDFTVSEDLNDPSITFQWSKSHWYKNFLIPIICLLPLLFRFNQCLRRYVDTGDRFPHLANATKYALSQTVTLFGAFHPLYLEYTTVEAAEVNLFQIFWMVLFVSSSLYSFAWDVYMDWGLGRPEYGFLGQTLMYPRRDYYYIVIAIDLVLRFMWVLTLVPPSSGAKFEVPSYLSAATMMLELFRRTIWGFLRLENEHRSNTAGFRRVGIVPLHFNTGHHHQYKEREEQSGQTVLREVVGIALAVVGVCVSSVVAAQRANRFTDALKEL